MGVLKVFALSGKTWVNTPIILLDFDQLSFLTCWAATTCYIIQAYALLYTDFFRGDLDLAFSPQRLIDGVASIHRGSAVKVGNWFMKDHSYSLATRDALDFAADYGITWISQSLRG
ncbi:hypothetical protein LIER_19750 [Lithospermum erythrorhizon]|uniref:Uncharacterized protein n=1 Tax=Lithospermum erythrorhizon TaxID=34254 RepID=A0AAV3QIX9_LITER